MATKKVIEVNESSIIDLKAELFRKEQQFRQESGSNKVKSDRSTTKKPPIWSKQTKSQSKSKSKPQQNEDNNGPSEEEKALQKSRQMLQAKAALYDKMAKGEIEDNQEEDGEGGRFLVDFHKKCYSEITQQESHDEESENIGPPTPPPTCPEEEWVDYVDSLGRSRRCLRKDLKELQQMDKDIKPTRSPSPPTLLSDDMRREIMRKKWEKEEEEAMNRPVGPVHYQNIQFDEVRHHGVGYYQFSKVEEERQKQMETLNKLREETTEQRSRIERVKDKRKAALEARLAKVRARKKIKSGETGDEDENKTTSEENMRREQ
ncbi:hypothetical protein QZH41_011341 [Actinostola sp. cb2023]|nr:hypothetical protein QZH41_011341 [Actinostola sp. cb2023]